jgi:TRAP-type C4-dicarboxylate transport system permease small subunit
MSPEEQLEPAASSVPPVIERLTGFIAILGGALALAAAVLVTASVLLRWLLSAPIDGDFEYVKMATAVAVFAYLPYTQARRGNIMVDTFTGWLPARASRLLDAVWDITYAGLMGYIAYCMTYGSLGMYRSGETTMVLQLALWPSVAICTALALLVAFTALLTAVQLVKHRPGPGSTSSGSSAAGSSS